MLDYLNPWIWTGTTDEKKRKRGYLAGSLRGEPESMYQLGYWAFREKNYFFAAKWLDKCVVLPGPYWTRASLIMGTIRYRNQDFDSAEYYWKQSAQNGNTSSMFNLAVLYKENEQISRALTWFEKAAKLGHLGSKKSLERIKNRPAPRASMTGQEAEHHAARWMKYWGFYDAKVNGATNAADGGIDIVATNAQAQVKYWSSPVGIQPINEFEGASSGLGEVKIFFSKSGYSKRAISRADQCKIALFTFNHEHTPKATNSIARDLTLIRN